MKTERTPDIRFGINMMLWMPETLRDPAELFAELKNLGYDGVEVPVDPSDPARYRGLRHALSNAGLAATATARGDKTADLSSRDRELRKKGVERALRAVELAASFDADLLGGPIHCAPGYVGEGSLDSDRIAQLADGLSEIAKSAGEAGLVLCPEILNRYESRYPNTLQQGAALADMVDSPSFGLHFDTYHAHIEEADSADAIRSHRKNIAHVHASESHRGYLGCGQVYWRQIARALGAVRYRGWITAEAFCPENTVLSHAMCIWRPAVTDAMHYARHALAHMTVMMNGLGSKPEEPSHA